MNKIVVIGSSNVDLIMKIDRLPRTGETITDALFLQTYGGKGANQAVGAAKAGGDVWLVNCVGDDAFGPLVKENLRQAGVHVDYVSEQRGVASGAALVMVGGVGENYLSVAPGANYKLTPDMIRALAPMLEDAAMVLLQYEVTPQSLYAAIDLASALGKPVMFNLAPARPLDVSVLSRIAYLVVNESEAQWLCGFPVDAPQRVAQAADALLRMGAAAVVLTLGAGGVFLASADIRAHVPAFQVEAVDTTAAGDVFCGALAVALVEGRPLTDAARFAGAAAALCVTRLGAQPSVPTRAEIEQFLQSAQASTSTSRVSPW
jgi:ribokinase